MSEADTIEDVLKWMENDNGSCEQSHEIVGVKWVKRYAIINPDYILAFNYLRDARKASVNGVPVFIAFTWIMRRCQYNSEIGVYVIKVVQYQKPG
eukprot:2062834-Karenia_brevis.AAC.1